MNASTHLTTTAPDTALLTRWAVQADTGADAFTVAEYDRLIALTPQTETRALAELIDCRAIEVELLGYDPSDLADIDALDACGDICPACSGSGEGMYDGATCRVCNGAGEVGDWPLFDEPDGDDWIDDFYAQVQRDELAERVA